MSVVAINFVTESFTDVHSAFAAIADLTGDWKKDPRYEESWYFVCEKPEAK